MQKINIKNDAKTMQKRMCWKYRFFLFFLEFSNLHYSFELVKVF